MIELEPEINLLYENYVMGNYEKLIDIVFRYREKLVNRPEKINPEKFLTDLKKWVNQVPISSPSYFNRMFVLDHFSDLMELEALNQDIELQRLRLEMIYQFGKEVNHPIDEPVNALMPTVKPKIINDYKDIHNPSYNIPIKVLGLDTIPLVFNFMCYLWFGSFTSTNGFLNHVLNNLEPLADTLATITPDLLNKKKYSGLKWLLENSNNHSTQGYENKLLLEYQLYLTVITEKPEFTNPTAIGLVSEIKHTILLEALILQADQSLLVT